MARLLIGNKFWFPKGGVETYLFDLLEELPARGYEVIPFAMRHPGNRASEYSDFFVDEVDYHAPHSWSSKLTAAARLLYSRHAARRLEALVDRYRPDLAHLHNVYHQLSPAILPVLSARGIPVVMTLHDLKLACPNYKMRTHGSICERCIGGGYHHAVLNRCVQGSVAASLLCAAEMFVHRRTRLYEDHVDCFIVPSRFYRQKMIEAGLPASKLLCLPSFTRIESYTPSYTGGGYIAYVGRLSEEKGVATLVEAVRGLKGATLLVIGDGPERPRLERMVAAGGLDNVRLLGAKGGTELIDLVRGASFSVIPSEWYENCPRSAIESFACGKPAIGADIGGIPEMVEDGETGLLFTPFSAASLREKIAYLLNRPAEVARMGRAARAKAEREYSAESHLARLLTIYQDALGARAAAIA